MASGLTFDIRMPRRRTELTPKTAYRARYFKVPEEVTPCHVLGIFQSSTEDGPYPTVACELNDGRIIDADLDEVKFVDTKDGILL